MKLNRRHQFLLGFGGIAVALLIVFNMWYPPVSEDSATGAVGAVKKHRQQQIAASDVILGDEAAKKEAQILYADFLTDAAVLQNRGVDLAMAMKNRDAQDLGVLRGELESLTTSLEKQTQQVEMRSYLAAQDALGRMTAFLAAAPANLENRSELEAQLASLRQDIESRSSQTLAVKDMEGVRAQLGRMVETLESARSLELASADRTVGRLDALRQEMENRAIDAASLGVMKAELAALTASLGRSAALQLAAVGRYEAYLGSMGREAEALGVARQALEAATANLEAKSEFSNADRLALEKAVQQLESRGAELENRAVENLESRMALVSLESKAVQDIDGSLGLFSQSLDNRSKQLSATARQDLALGVKAAEQALASRRASFENQSLAAAQLELAALGAHLEQRAKFDNRWAEASVAGNRAEQMENRGAQLENFREYLGRMSSAFASRAAEMENRGQSLDSQRRTELQNRAKELENRAQELGSASAWGRV